AHQQFAELIGRVRSLVEQAKAEKFTVTSQGVAVYDADSVQAMRHDPDFQKYQAQVKIAEAAWTKQIKDAVRAVDDADQGVKLALHQAAGVRSWFDRLRDPLGRDHAFNGSAVGDIEVYEAREAEKYTDRILGGEKLDGTELAEWERLMRDNSGDEVFSRTVLDHVGPEGTIRLTNQLNDLAYDSDKGNRQQYLAVEKGFATAVATATRDPDSAFYREWREGLREAGTRRYEWQGEEVTGYQSFVTLMQQGGGYSERFLHDLGDDLIAAERADRGDDIWDLPKGFVRARDDWFANDPLDGLLGVMSHDPGAAEGFLDPAVGSGDRLEYLLRERDWNVVDGHPAMRNPMDPDRAADDVLRQYDIEDAASRSGLGAALIAGATGIDPANSSGGFVPHSAANDRVFEASLGHLAAEGNDFPPQLREPMALIMGNHGDAVHEATSAHNDSETSLNRQHVLEVAKQISRDQNAYGTLHDSLNREMVHDINTGAEGDEEPLRRAGRTIGFLEEARYQGLQVDVDDAKSKATWDAKWDYHTWGGLVNFIPHAGDAAQRGVDVITSKWLEEEMSRIQEGQTRDNLATGMDREGRLDVLAALWARENPGVEETPYMTVERIDDAANNGNAAARRLAGGGS
ncbi:MAG: hypothetical protein H5T76_25150, partial [Streptomyces sp.]|nr:hypothetical protein [Streptomyces sp.]